MKNRLSLKVTELYFMLSWKKNWGKIEIVHVFELLG